MLVLSRKVGEAILLGDVHGADVEVVVLGVEGDTVRLGIRAPIWCKELFEAVAGENRAATADPASLRDLFREPGVLSFSARPSDDPPVKEKKTPSRD